MRRRDLILAAGAAGGLALFSGQACAASETGTSGLRIVQSGHSLTDGVMEPLASMIRSSGIRGGSLAKSTIPGSPMEWRWNNAPGGDEPDIRDPDVMAGFDVLVITERVSLANTAGYHDSSGMALRWAEHAWRYGNGGKGARSILYATWVDVISGPDFENPHNDPEAHLTFRERLPLEMAGWEEIRAYVNQNRPDDMPEMEMIPGPLIMAAADDDIRAGKAPDLSDLTELFADDIHLNERGNYMIALAHYAVIYGRDPRGLPANIPPRSGPGKEQAAWMQDLVWRVLRDYRGGA